MSFSELIFIIFALCFDSFAISVSYGISDIRILMSSVAIIGIVSGAVLAFSFAVASPLGEIISQEVCHKIGASLILILAGISLAKSAIDSAVRKNIRPKSKLLCMYINETLADTDKSKTLTVKEALLLAPALSSDGLAIGICTGPSMCMKSKIIAVILAVMMSVFLVSIGQIVGRKMFLKLGKKVELNCFQGIILLVLGLCMLV